MNSPTLFGINGNNLMVGGEAGQEAILPLSKLWKELDKQFQKQNNILNNSNGDKDINITLNLDGKVVTATVIKNINQMTRRNNVSPLR